MAQDLFEDSTMTFGEHIEELRVHLLRALKGVVVAFVAMTFVGDRVVKLLTQPVEDQLHKWYTTRLRERATLVRTQIEALPAEARPQVELETSIPAAELRGVFDAFGITPAKTPTEPLTVRLRAEIGDLIEKINLPLTEIRQPWHMRSLSAQEPFMIYFKAVLGAALVGASPWVFYQIYSFVAVGLYAHEKRFVHLTLPFSVGLFLLGVATCFFLVFPAMLNFFFATNTWMDIEPEIRLSEWVGFAVILMLIFGIMFQMPLLMLMLERVGIVSYEQLASKRRIAVFVNCIVAAAVTPGGDPNTMLLLALPMCFLFELGLQLMRYFQRRNPFAVSEPEFDT